MSLITQITTVINTLYPNVTVILSSKFSANIQSFSLPAGSLPVAIIDNEQPNNSEIKKNNNLQRDTQIKITILDQDSKENTDAQSQALCDAAMAMADRIAANIFQIDEIRPKDNQQYKITPAFHFFVSDLTGVILEIQCNYNTTVDMSLIP
jgi:hypothetical protein